MSAPGRALIIGLLVPLATAACSGGHRSDGNRLIVLDRSIGGVALKEKRTDVERLLDRSHAICGDPEHLRYSAAGLEVWYVSGAPSEPATDYIFAVRTRSPRYRTPQGVRVGSTAADVRRIRGVKCFDVDCQHGFRAAAKPGTGFRLDRPGGRVVYIDVAVDAS